MGTGKRGKPPTQKAKSGVVRVRRRDDFLESTIRTLRDMAGNVCSFPDCSVHTHGAKGSLDGAFSIGVACHITAAAPGGPRYDQNQSAAERRDVSNGIWMCQTHSRLVDADDSPYPVELLREWKRQAEIRANQMVNQRAFTERELKSAVKDESVDILGRYINRFTDPLGTPVNEMLSTYESGMSEIDPRFKVRVNKSASGISHEIFAVAPDAKFNLLIRGVDELKDFEAAERAFFEEGRELSIPSSNFEFAGSKLFEAIHQRLDTDRVGSIVLGGIKKKINANLFACDGEGHEHFIDSFDAEYSSGTLRTIIQGSCLGGFLTFEHRLEHNGGSLLNMSIDVKAWQGLDVLELPLFGRLTKALQYLEKGSFVVEFEVANRLVRIDTKQSPESNGFAEHFSYFITMIDQCRKIAEKCEDNIFMLDINFTEEVIVFLRKLTRLIDNKIIGRRAPSMLCRGTFDWYDGYSVEDLDDKVQRITLQNEIRPEINLLGQMVKAPRISSTYTGVEAVLYCDLEEREQVKMEIVTTENTLIEHQFNDVDRWEVLALPS
ncbi:hypothetical protein PHLH6_38800 [Pseudomonas sp. Seg1]|nr:hypothetical protein PHLH6_38800 [Pseudomonas sp. Seg1]